MDCMDFTCEDKYGCKNVHISKAGTVFNKNREHKTKTNQKIYKTEFIKEDTSRCVYIIYHISHIAVTSPKTNPEL